MTKRTKATALPDASNDDVQHGRAYRGHHIDAEPSIVADEQYVAFVDGEEVGSAASALAALDVAKKWVRRHDRRARTERVEIVDDDYMAALRASLKEA